MDFPMYHDQIWITGIRSPSANSPNGDAIVQLASGSWDSCVLCSCPKTPYTGTSNRDFIWFTLGIFWKVRVIGTRISFPTNTFQTRHNTKALKFYITWLSKQCIFFMLNNIIIFVSLSFLNPHQTVPNKYAAFFQYQTNRFLHWYKITLLSGI